MDGYVNTNQKGPFLAEDFGHGVLICCDLESLLFQKATLASHSGGPSKTIAQLFSRPRPLPIRVHSRLFAVTLIRRIPFPD